MYCGAAKKTFSQMNFVIPFRCNMPQHANSFARYFGPDAITGKYQNVEVHS